MTFDWGYAGSILPLLLNATVVTIAATFGGFVLALIAGLGLALLRLSRWPLVSRIATLYVDFIRGTPLLIQLFFVFFVLPQYGLTFDPFVTGVVGLGMNYSAYTAEVYRAGIQDVPKGQWEAATAISLGRTRTWAGIILPQAIPPMVPVLGNYLLAMYKDSPLLATITVQELLGVALAQASTSFRYLEPLTIVGLIFLTLSYPSALLLRQAGNRMRSHDVRPSPLY